MDRQQLHEVHEGKRQSHAYGEEQSHVSAQAGKQLGRRSVLMDTELAMSQQ